MPLLDDIMESGVYGASNMSRMHSSTITLGVAERQRAGKKRLASGLIRTVFPPLSYMRGSYPILKKTPVLLPATWISRIIRYLKERRLSAKIKTEDKEAGSVKIGRDRVELMKYYEIV